MRVPVRHLAGNVIWTLHGTVWAIWRIEGSAQVNASRRAKKERLATVETLVKQLRGESMLLSLCPQINPATVVEKMTAAVDLAASPRYEELAHTMLDQLEQVELTGRTDWLAVQLPTSRRQALGEALRAARAEVALELGLLPAPVTAQQERERLAQAADLASAWPSGIARRPATEAEIMWIYGHSARRGVIEPLLPHDAPKARGRGRGMAGLGQVVLAEGGLPEQRKSRPARPRLGRRWLEATTEWGTSYQCLLGLSQMPKEFVFPGSEFLARVDQFPYPVDWAVRLSVESGADAEPKSRRQAEELAGQYSEYEGEPSGPPSGVDEANEGIHEYRGRLTSSASEVEVRAMTALCVWGDTPPGSRTPGEGPRRLLRRPRVRLRPAPRRNGEPLARHAARRPHPTRHGRLRPVPPRPGLLHERPVHRRRTGRRQRPALRPAARRRRRTARLHRLLPRPPRARLRLGRVRR
ncbi:hypothetical protein ACWIGN_15370 [Streptomyces albidoflavus]